VTHDDALDFGRVWAVKNPPERKAWPAPIYPSRRALLRALLGRGCVLPTPRELELYALASRIRRAFEVCR
jgi:hypothetical protein